MQNLTLLDEVFDRAGDVLDRHGGIDTVLVVEVDAVGSQPLERFFDDLRDMHGAAVQGDRAVNLEPEFACYHHLVADRRKRLADKLLVCIWPVDLGCVEEGNALLERGADGLDALGLVGSRAIVGADAHASGADFRDF